MKFVHKRYLFFLGLTLLFPFQSVIAQCDSTVQKFFGTIQSKSGTVVKMRLAADSPTPEKGTVGDMSKYFETTIFGIASSGWLGIAKTKVKSVKGYLVDLEILEEKSEMIINGTKKNHFERGNDVMIEWLPTIPIDTVKTVLAGGGYSIEYIRCDELYGTKTYYYPNDSIREVNRYKNGKLNGPYYVLGRYGDTLETGFFEDGKREGLRLIYWEKNGQLYKRERYHKNFQNGLSEQWFANGKKEFELTYLGGVLHGNFTDYFKTGDVKGSGNYKQGQYDGEVKIYYGNGQLKYTAHYIEGVKEGSYNSFYEDGNKFISTNFVNDKKEGDYKEWFRNGQLRFECGFHQGEKDGIWKVYYENGQVAQAGTFENGKEEGEWQEFYGDGRPKVYGVFAAGEKTGKWFEWSSDGKKTKTKYD